MIERVMQICVFFQCQALPLLSFSIFPIEHYSTVSLVSEAYFVARERIPIRSIFLQLIFTSYILPCQLKTIKTLLVYGLEWGFRWKIHLSYQYNKGKQWNLVDALSLENQRPMNNVTTGRNRAKFITLRLEKPLSKRNFFKKK